jgi:hypothetical protein
MGYVILTGYVLYALVVGWAFLERRIREDQLGTLFHTRVEFT